VLPLGFESPRSGDPRGGTPRIDVSPSLGLRRRNARLSAGFAIRTVADQESSAEKATDVAVDAKLRTRSVGNRGSSSLFSAPCPVDGNSGARLRARGLDSARQPAGSRRTPLLAKRPHVRRRQLQPAYIRWRRRFAKRMRAFSGEKIWNLPSLPTWCSTQCCTAAWRSASCPGNTNCTIAGPVMGSRLSSS